MFNTPEYSKYVKQINKIMMALDDCTSDQERVATVKKIYSFILKHKGIICTQIKNTTDANERYIRFYKMLNVFIEKSYEIHNDAIIMYIGDAETLDLCRKLERFARTALFRYFNQKPCKHLMFLESPYVRRSPRLAANSKPVYYFNPYSNVAPLRRSARLANK